MKLFGIMAIAVAILAGVAITVTAALHFHATATRPPAVSAPVVATLPARPQSYLGVYVPGVPDSYSAVPAFTRTTGVKPDLLVYYSGWREPFRASFADAAAKEGAVPAGSDRPGKRQPRSDRVGAVRQLPEYLRHGRSDISPSCHPELRP